MDSADSRTTVSMPLVISFVSSADSPRETQDRHLAEAQIYPDQGDQRPPARVLQPPSGLYVSNEPADDQHIELWLAQAVRRREPGADSRDRAAREGILSVHGHGSRCCFQHESAALLHERLQCMRRAVVLLS